MFGPISTLLFLPIFASCASVKPSVVVKSEVVKVHVPDAFTVQCPKPDRRQWRTTRDVIASVDANEAALRQCAAQIDGIRQWNASPSP